MAAFHSFRNIAFVYVFVQLLLLSSSSLVHFACAAPFIPSRFPSVPLSLSNAPPSTSSPLSPRSDSGSPSLPPPTLTKREKFTLQTLPNGSLVAFSDTTLQPIPQGPASDGAGSGFDAPAILWLGYAFGVGAPMAVGGARMGRGATGVGVGGAAAMLAWTSLINSLGPDGLADLVILLVVFGFFVAGFVVGILKWGMHVGVVLIGVTGGLSLGVRVVLMKEGLVISDMAFYAANWVVVAALGVAGGVGVVGRRWQKWGVAVGCASIGTFLVFLGVDLVVNRQSGMSRGLRFLFDRNSNHIVDIITTGYKPTTSTQILLGASLGATPLLAWAQHHFFLRTRPFLPTSPEPVYTDPTMGRYTAEPESIYIVDSEGSGSRSDFKGSNSDFKTSIGSPNTATTHPSQSTVGSGLRGNAHHRAVESWSQMRSSVLGWLGMGPGVGGGQDDGDRYTAGPVRGRPAEGRMGAVVYQGQEMRSVEGKRGHGNVLGKIRPLRKDS